MFNYPDLALIFFTDNPTKNTIISNTVIQIREIKLTAIARGVGRIDDNNTVITPSLTPNPEGAKSTTKPMIHDRVCAPASVKIDEIGN